MITETELDLWFLAQLKSGKPTSMRVVEEAYKQRVRMEGNMPVVVCGQIFHRIAAKKLVEYSTGDKGVIEEVWLTDLGKREIGVK